MFNTAHKRERAQERAELQSKVDAIHRSQAVIEFQLDGTILAANENFLSTLGYTEAEVVGRHHRMFVAPEYAASAEYQAFWGRLSCGEYFADKYLRYGKGGREIWIQATYNPMLDADGKPYKVVKFATDVTQIELERRANEAERREAQERQAAAVEKLGAGLSALARGDLRTRIEGPFPEEYARLRDDFNAAVEQLSGVIAAIVEAADAMGSGAREVSQASDDLSRRTEQQAASLEETAAALDEITATVKTTADRAQQAREVVSAARGDAEASGEIVRSAVVAMGEIDASSRQITQIIGVIDEIAFQTNLLALNAGVEAARAGEAGRGFAVVASEVRALAQRSAEAAKEIKTLISTSTGQVGSGVALVGRAGEALQRIVAQVADLNGLIGEIAASAQEQATGLNEVNGAVNQMDQITQQNAAMVEQSTAASHSLASQSDELAQLMSRFTINPSQTAVHPRAAEVRSFAPARAPAGRAQRPAFAGSAALKLAPAPSTEGWENF
jgi:methyl-accepting chemotaxis protein